ncbi:hypothetical protein V1506DRAFT_516544 [Lipomyces tetrasporus]
MSARPLSLLTNNSESSLIRHLKKCTQPQVPVFGRYLAVNVRSLRLDATCSGPVAADVSCAERLASTPRLFLVERLAKFDREGSSEHEASHEIIAGVSTSAEEYQTSSLIDLLLAGTDQLTNPHQAYPDTTTAVTGSSAVTTLDDSDGTHATSPDVSMIQDQWMLSLWPTETPTSALAKHSMEFLFRVLRTWPRMMADEIQLPPLIHTTHFSNKALPLPLANCFTLAKMWMGNDTERRKSFKPQLLKRRNVFSTDMEPMTKETLLQLLSIGNIHYHVTLPLQEHNFGAACRPVVFHGATYSVSFTMLPGLAWSSRRREITSDHPGKPG